MTTARAEFVNSRQLGIGGSDIGSLLSNRIDVEYGCERNLWARLSGIPTDHPENETELMTLGNILEPFVARAYSDLTGRRVEEVGLQRHAVHPSLQVHADRIIWPAAGDEHETPGVLEIKAVGREMMRKINEQGMPVDYVLQLNHGMLCHGVTWGEFAIGTREDLLPLVAIELTARMAGNPMPKLPRQPKIVHFEMRRDPDICAAIEEYGPMFWETVGAGEEMAPPRLEPEDPRCGRCPRKIWCQGAALMEGIEPESYIPQRPELLPLVEQYRVSMALLEQCQAVVKETEDGFRAALDKTTAVRVPVGDTWKNIIYRIRKGGQRVDGRAMAVQYDTLRRGAIAAGLPGAELTPPSSEYARTGGPSRPLLLSALLPKKAKGKGEVHEYDEGVSTDD